MIRPLFVACCFLEVLHLSRSVIFAKLDFSSICSVLLKILFRLSHSRVFNEKKYIKIFSSSYIKRESERVRLARKSAYMTMNKKNCRFFVFPFKHKNNYILRNWTYSQSTRLRCKRRIKRMKKLKRQQNTQKIWSKKAKTRQLHLLNQS